MILLDTNVVSELMSPHPEPRIVRWLDQYPAQTLYITAITEAEIRFGITLLPLGKRQSCLLEAAETLFDSLFTGRILSFGRSAAAQYAQIAAHRRRMGRPITTADCQIAALARDHDALLATRNIRDFEETNVNVINPWDLAL